MIYHLYRWSVQYRELSPYQAPELMRAVLVGFRDTQADMIRTSSLMEAKGREITTYSGSVYVLQDMDTDFRDWLADNGFQYDPDDPIKIKKV